jgi:hypothetical protein
LSQDLVGRSSRGDNPEKIDRRSRNFERIAAAVDRGYNGKTRREIAVDDGNDPQEY